MEWDMLSMYNMAHGDQDSQIESEIFWFGK
jgi:hypothetical protein